LPVHSFHFDSFRFISIRLISFDFNSLGSLEVEGCKGVKHIDCRFTNTAWEGAPGKSCCCAAAPSCGCSVDLRDDPLLMVLVLVLVLLLSMLLMLMLMLMLMLLLMLLLMRVVMAREVRYTD